MKIKDALLWGANQLPISESKNLDASLILSNILNLDRSRLYASLNDVLSEKEIIKYKKNILKRSNGFPVAYITNHKEFFGNDFYIEEGVLCPRPDSEILIEAILQHNFKNKMSILDLCTGTGALGLTLQLEKIDWVVDCSDISEKSEKVCKENISRLNLNKVSFIKSDLFHNIKKKYDIIVSNPPYITPDEWYERKSKGWKEPELALNGNDIDGLRIIRDIIDNICLYLKIGGYFFLEAAPEQFPIIIELLKKKDFYKFVLYKDLAGDNRVLETVYGRQ